jgi:hypothetical protein
VVGSRGGSAAVSTATVARAAAAAAAQQRREYAYGMNRVSFVLGIVALASAALLLRHFLPKAFGSGDIVIWGFLGIHVLTRLPLVWIRQKIVLEADCITLPCGLYTRQQCRLRASDILSHATETYRDGSSSSYTTRPVVKVQTAQKLFTVDSKYCSGDNFSAIQRWLSSHAGPSR